MRMNDIAVELLAYVTGGADDADPCGQYAADANAHKQAWMSNSQSSGADHHSTTAAYQRYLAAVEQHRRCASR